ncbi:MAG TPA: HAD family phosphatase [Acidobacteriaceae bacterium]|nr:HAD family phosphatase [Acidobacteriaceae bacterium]
MPQIRAVLFDFGLVLSGPPDPVARRRMETILNVSHPELRGAYWRHRDDYDLGVLNGVSFWRIVGAELGHPPTGDELAQLLQADVDLWTKPNQPMIDWAAALQSAGVSTGILSNMGDAMETGIAARFPWLAGFTHCTFSHRLGIAKPDERIYRYAIAGIGEPPQATLFIDDRLENVEAARMAGLRAIQYTSHGDFLRAFQDTGFTGLPLPATKTTPSAP